MKHQATILYLTTNYPKPFESPQAAVDYDEALGDADPTDTLAAAKWILSNSTNAFRPMPAEVKERVSAAERERLEKMTDIERRRWKRRKDLPHVAKWFEAMPRIVERGQLQEAVPALLQCLEIVGDARAQEHFEAARNLVRTLRADAQVMAGMHGGLHLLGEHNYRLDDHEQRQLQRVEDVAPKPSLWKRLGLDNDEPKELGQ